jgi:hypothetical protein
VLLLKNHACDCSVFMFFASESGRRNHLAGGALFIYMYRRFEVKC